MVMAQENERWAERQDSIGKEIYDSLMHAEAQRDMLKDSTETDRLKSELMEAISHVNRWKLTSSTVEKQKAAAMLDTLGQRLYKQQKSTGVMAHPYIYAEACYQYSFLYMTEKDVKSAYSLMDEALKYCPDNVKYLEFMADICQMTSDKEVVERSADCYRRLVKINPKDRNVAQYHLQLATLYAYQGNVKKSIREVGLYEKTEGSSLETLGYKASIYGTFDKINDAIKCFDRYVKENPIDRYQVRMMELDFLRKAKKMDVYEQILDQMAEEYPNDAQLMINKALNAGLVKNDYKSYTEYMERLIESGNLDDVFDPALVNRMVAYRLEQKDTAAVTAIARKMEEIYPDNEQIIIHSGKIYNSIGDSASMRRVTGRLVEIAPENSNYLHELLTLCNAASLEDSVRMVAKSGYERFGNDDWKYTYLMSLVLDTSNLEEFLERGKQIIPTISEPGVKGFMYGMLGDFYALKKREAERDAAYDSALVYTPDNAMVLNNVAFYISQKENVTDEELAKAERMAAKALKGQPNSAAVLDTYGWILYLRGDRISAKLYLDKCVKIVEENGEKMSVTECYHLYEVYKSLENPKAQEWLEKGKVLLKEDPDSTDEQKIKELFR